MEVNIENLLLKYLVEYALSKAKAIEIISIDPEDYGQTFTIETKDITSIEEDVLTDKDNCFMIWWKKYSELEGKYITNSNHFIIYKLID